VTVSEALNLLLVIVLLLNFLMLGTSRLRAVIHAAAGQGTLLGVAYLTLHGPSGARALVLGAAMIAIKGIAIPRILMGALRSQGIRREVEPFVSFTASLLLGALATGLAVLFAGTLPLQPGDESALLVPASLSTVLTGFIVLTTRRKALTQVVGYLTLENGIFIFGLSLVEALPFLVETGVLLDVLVGVFVMGVVVDHISREFSSIAGDELTELRE
jgi:hydrogenase-4 component E